MKMTRQLRLVEDTPEVVVMLRMMAMKDRSAHSAPNSRYKMCLYVAKMGLNIKKQNHLIM